MKTEKTDNLTNTISVKLGDLLLHTLPSGDDPEHFSLPVHGPSNRQDVSAQPHLPPSLPSFLCCPRRVCHTLGGVHEQVSYLLKAP